MSVMDPGSAGLTKTAVEEDYVPQEGDVIDEDELEYDDDDDEDKSSDDEEDGDESGDEDAVTGPGAATVASTAYTGGLGLGAPATAPVLGTGAPRPGNDAFAQATTALRVADMQGTASDVAPFGTVPLTQESIDQYKDAVNAYLSQTDEVIPMQVDQGFIQQMMSGDPSVLLRNNISFRLQMERMMAIINHNRRVQQMSAFENTVSASIPIADLHLARLAKAVGITDEYDEEMLLQLLVSNPDRVMKNAQWAKNLVTELKRLGVFEQKNPYMMIGMLIYSRMSEAASVAQTAASASKRRKMAGGALPATSSIPAALPATSVIPVVVPPAPRVNEVTIPPLESAPIVAGAAPGGVPQLGVPPARSSLPGLS